MSKKQALGRYANKNIEFSSAIKSCRTRTRMSLDKLIQLADISRNTYYVHLREPDKITLGELRVYIRTLNIPKEDIINALYLDDK